ncbi:MAG: hypothetical protein Q8R05_05015 [Candidatus Omnitrophota bacterium]|nr:hypothetical protein [Candidatus Omnitrophota bacterium]
MKKKGTPEQEALRLFFKSKYYKKLSKEAKELIKNPIFKKDLKVMISKYPPLTEKQVVKLYGTKEWEERIKAWQDFMDRRGIKFMIGNKPMLKGTIKLSIDREGLPSITQISREATRQDSLAFSSLQTLLKNHYLGKATITQGRKEDIKRNKAMKKEYVTRRKKGEKPTDIIDNLLEKYQIKHKRAKNPQDPPPNKRVKDIVLSKKYD